MEEHSCSLCFRRFPSGRALGGHMRSHVTAAALAPKLSRHRQCAVGHGAGTEDQEGESLFPRAQRKRSRRTRLAHSPASSASDVTADEDVARCLMMLSRDSRAGEAEENGSCQFAVRPRPPRRGRSKRPSRTFGRVSAVGGEVFECPFCFRVFPSGQALGGHKRSHLSAATSSISATPTPLARLPLSLTTSSKYGNGLVSIDLNLPAEMEDNGAVLDHSVNLDFHSSRI